MKRLIKFTGNAGLAIALVLMAVLVFFTIGSKISVDGIPKIANYKMLVVLSGSMHPTFEAGDVIIIDGGKGGTVFKKGDVITFKDPEDNSRIVTHRIVEVLKQQGSNSYHTKGDTNNTNDLKPVPAANIIGQQKWRIPYFGKVVEFAKTKQGLIYLILIPGFLIIIGEVRSITKIIKEEIERKRQEAVKETCSAKSQD